MARPASAWPVYASLSVLWLATRVFAILSVDLTPWMLHDLKVYKSWLPQLHQLAFPLGDPTWQYPPGAGLVLLASSSGTLDYRWSFTLAILLIDAAILGTLMVAHARQRESSWRGVALWAMAGVVVGPIMMTRFDVAPTFFAVAAIVLATRPVWSGSLSAIGAIVKVWPGLMILSIPRREAKRGVIAFVATAAVVLLVLALVFDNSLSFLGNQRDRGLQVESTGALPFLLFSLSGGRVAFGISYGSVQVLMNGAETVGTIITVAGFVVLGAIAWWRWTGRLDRVPPGDIALAAILVSLATSRVYSPQFNTWLVGVAAAAILSARSRVSLVAWIIVAASLVTQVVYPWSGTQLVHGGYFAVTVQAVRIILLLSATILCLFRVLQGSRQPSTSEPEAIPA